MFLVCQAIAAFLYEIGNHLALKSLYIYILKEILNYRLRYIVF